MPWLHPSSRARSSHNAESLSSSTRAASAFSLASSHVSIPMLHFSTSFLYCEEAFLTSVVSSLVRSRRSSVTFFWRRSSSASKANLPFFISSFMSGSWSPQSTHNGNIMKINWASTKRENLNLRIKANFHRKWTHTTIWKQWFSPRVMEKVVSESQPQSHEPHEVWALELPLKCQYNGGPKMQQTKQKPTKTITNFRILWWLNNLWYEGRAIYFQEKQSPTRPKFWSDWENGEHPKNRYQIPSWRYLSNIQNLLWQFDIIWRVPNFHMIAKWRTLIWRYGLTF